MEASPHPIGAGIPECRRMRILPTVIVSLLLTACGPQEGARFALPEVTRLPPGQVSYVPPGEALRNGYPATPAPRIARYPEGLAIMTRQVSQAEYAACVRAGGCKAPDPAQRQAVAPDLPAVGISWTDASAYAAWLSARTGQRFRLPSYAEWVYAAGEAYREDALPALPDGADPAQRWLAEYEQQSRRGAQGDDTVRTFGAFGSNRAGLMDMAGSVWDWTDDCHARHVLDALRDDAPANGANGANAQESRNCGIRVAAGRHIAYLPDFIRDPKGGACSVGVPPANLGLRLVLESG
ncbi:formylglycine-generating enzyme family protein [Achromobacter sp.]|uniref:formylglycine-generating enzyme family protein n=1 Tax=Achromobacter sp. TaxID=134375 RepID=UPI003C796C8F